MKIGIIGAGNVGAALGRGWARTGHEVKFGVREAKDARVSDLLAEVGANATAASVAEAAAFGEVIVLATPWPATKGLLEAMGDLQGKILLDCTNPLKPNIAGLELGHDTSGGEQVAAWAAGARVVKIFNTTGVGNMRRPQYGSERTTMLYCGDDATAKAVAAQLAADLGFDPVDAGLLRQARLLEPLALLWISLAHQQGMGQDFAFRLVRRES